MLVVGSWPNGIAECHILVRFHYKDKDKGGSLTTYPLGSFQYALLWCEMCNCTLHTENNKQNNPSPNNLFCGEC